MTTLFFERNPIVHKGTSAAKYDPPELTKLDLPIRMHYSVLPRTILGSETLYCYWKIGLWLDLINRVVLVYIPPEWRSLPCDIFRQWIGILRMHPFENITLGGTHYQWVDNVLMPEGQDPALIPIAGMNDWPETPGYTHVWNDLLPKRDAFSISINRRPLPDHLDLHRLTHYWRITVHPQNRELITIWVPPEWRQLSDPVLHSWVHQAVVNENLNPIILGGVKYRWERFTLMPEEQRVELIQYDTRPLANPWLVEPASLRKNGSNTPAGVKANRILKKPITSTSETSLNPPPHGPSDPNEVQTTESPSEPPEQEVLDLSKYPNESIAENMIPNPEFQEILETMDTVSLSHITPIATTGDNANHSHYPTAPEGNVKNSSPSEEAREPPSLCGSSYDIPFKYFKEYYNY